MMIRIMVASQANALKSCAREKFVIFLTENCSANQSNPTNCVLDVDLLILGTVERKILLAFFEQYQ